MGEEDNNSSSGVVWNFDDSEAKLIFNYRNVFIHQLKQWSLNEAYWTLRILRMECKMFCTEDENKQLDSLQQNIDKEKNELDKKKVTTDKAQSDFALSLEALYTLINRYIKIHKLCFREREEDEGL